MTIEIPEGWIERMEAITTIEEMEALLMELPIPEGYKDETVEMMRELGVYEESEYLAEMEHLRSSTTEPLTT